MLFDYDITRRSMGGKRFKMQEVALYTVKNDKIVREELFLSSSWMCGARQQGIARRSR